MKIVFFSDVHGCRDSLQELQVQIGKIEPELLVLLGDALYHGPRNPLLPDYAPTDAVRILNSFRDKIVAVRGNCDSEVDQMLLEFPIMADYSHLLFGHRRFFLTHGHHWNPQQPPALPHGSILAYGHTHLPQLEKCGELIAFNPGSISLPKGGNPATFGVYENHTLSIRKLADGTIIRELPLA